jgi:hypothetical protein
LVKLSIVALRIESETFVLLDGGSRLFYFFSKSNLSNIKQYKFIYIKNISTSIISQRCTIKMVAYFVLYKFLNCFHLEMDGVAGVEVICANKKNIVRCSNMLDFIYASF